MCQQLQQVASNNNNNKMKPTYSIKKVLKTLFKKQQKAPCNKIANSLESLEYEDNLRNTQVEEVYYAEIDENCANEKLAQMVAEEKQQQQQDDDDAEEDIYVPVRFARTEAGTFFWTTNLQPVSSVIMPTVEDDLFQPTAYCYTNQQFPIMQYQDRWVQA